MVEDGKITLILRNAKELKNLTVTVLPRFFWANEDSINHF